MSRCAAACSLVLLTATLGACKSGDEDALDGLAILGSGTHDLAAVDLAVVASSDDKLALPRDIAFHPVDADQAWIVNQRSESITIISDIGTPSQDVLRRKDSTGAHFLARPSGLAMGDDGTFATIHDTDEMTQGPDGTPPDFMGPTLWPSDPDAFDGGHGSHMDMLHNSPLGKGIAWEEKNTFWVFDGFHGALTRYAFRGDHGPGGADHSDGKAKRYVDGEVSGVDELPSHIEYDDASELLYVADTGNRRIAVLDTQSGSPGSEISPNYDQTGSNQKAVDGADLWTLVDATTGGFDLPTGLALHDGMVFVSDAGTGQIRAFTLDGALVDYLDVGGSPNGLAFHSSGDLFYVDSQSDEVVRIRAL